MCILTCVTKTLREALSTRDNSLNFVRLCLAAAVIISHAFPLGGFEKPFWLPDLGGWAVSGFFAISGYLIAGSRMRLRFFPFTVHRVMRIFPAFWAVLLGVAFVLAPLTTVLTGEDYSPGSALEYVLKNAGLYIWQRGVEDTLLSVPYPVAWNGALWTLFYEFAAYMCAAVLLTLAVVRKHAVVATSVALVATVTFQILAPGPLQVTTTLYLNGARLGAFFLAGMLLYFLADRIKLRTWPLAGAILIMVLLSFTGLIDLIAQLPFAFIVLWLGAKLKVRFGQKNDVSYGVYIWGFPVQQTLAVSGVAVALGPWLAALAALLLTLPLAWASWRLVERPGMRLGKKIAARYPGRPALATRATQAKPD